MILHERFGAASRGRGLGLTRRVGLVGAVVLVGSACGENDRDPEAGGASGAAADAGGGSDGGASDGGAADGGSDQGGASVGGASGESGEGGDGGVASGGESGSAGSGISAGGAGGTVGMGGDAGGGGTAHDPDCPKPAGEICHRFLAAENFHNELRYVNEFDPTHSWSVDVGDTGAHSPRQIALVENPSAKGKAVMVSTTRGYAEFDAVDGTPLVSVQLFDNVTGAVRLDDGTTALGVENSSVHIVDRYGNVLRQFSLPGTGDLRTLHRDSSGVFWYGREQGLFAVDEQENVLFSAELPLGCSAYNVLPLPGGGAMATSGGCRTVNSYDAQGELAGQLGMTEQAPPSLDFHSFDGFVRLPNGNVVVANWDSQTDVHVLEFSPSNEIVWTWGDESVAQITNVLVLR